MDWSVSWEKRHEVVKALKRCHPEGRRSRREGPYDGVQFRECRWECPCGMQCMRTSRLHRHCAPAVRSLGGRSALLRMTASFGDLCFAVDFGPPPADADEEESPVVKKLRRLAFKRVADELKPPSENKQGQRDIPEAVREESSDGNSQ